MDRRDFLKALGLGAAALALPRTLAAAQSDAKRPNILFIFADDQTFEGVRALGNDEVHTPNLDRLVRNGVAFTHAYNQGSWTGAVCVASRTMLNTGMFLWHAQRVDKGADTRFKQGGKLWSQLIDSAGYDTYMTGKWHVKADAASIFDLTTNIRGGMPKQTKAGYNRPIEGQPDPWKPWDKKFGGFWEGGKHWSEVLGDDAVGFLDQASKSDSPFYMYLAFNAPHDPRQSPKEYVDKYPLDKVKVPENFVPEHPDKDAIACGKRQRDESLAPFPRTPYAVKVNRQEYYAIITHMDTQVGRILDALEKSGKADNTYIFFSADHGLAVGHHGLMGKQNLYDHSVRVPLMVVGPGIRKDKKIDTPVYLQDIMPSTLQLAGVEKPDHVQFKSLMPLIEGKAKESYDAIYGGYLTVARMVTQAGYKLLLFPKIKKVFLFNLKKDPLEMENLADNPKYRRRIKKLFAKLIDLQKQTGDQLDLKSIYPDLL
ncbi:MAG: sulfatase-like hydrolase/transferase [Planctomycetes bacterium]|nr:sulfatase-like hydrolase/transferase [Planctomycetota bacterium]